MAYPKGFITNINTKIGKIGTERREEITEQIMDKNAYLPSGVLEEDMDREFVDTMSDDKGFKLTLAGEVVPVHFVALQRWSEFLNSWQTSDKYKDIGLPFITVIRKIDIQQGDNQAGLWNIPGDRTYSVYKVPTWDGIRKGIDLYKIPQPTSIDMLYEVRIFTTRMRDLNKFSRLVQKRFQSSQFYLNVKGHYMPLKLGAISDESVISDFENKRFFVQSFQMTLKGYILDPDDFEVQPTVNRMLVATEVCDDSGSLQSELIIFQENDTDTEVVYNATFKSKSPDFINITANNDMEMVELKGLTRISNVEIFVNGISVSSGTSINGPIPISHGDRIKFKITKNLFSIGSFTIVSNKII